MLQLLRVFGMSRKNCVQIARGIGVEMALDDGSGDGDKRVHDGGCFRVS